MNKATDKIIFDGKVSNRKILLIPIDTIAATPYNPMSRTKNGKKLQKLSESVDRYGLIQPLLITADRDLVDGNRRLAAAKMANKKFVECIILPDEVDKDEIFCTVNTTAEKIGGKGWLEACRHGYKKPPAEVYAQYQDLLKLVGTYGIDLMIENRVGLNILSLCKTIKAQGVAKRLDEIIITVCKDKLTNKANAILRADISREERARQLSELLQ